MSPAEILSIRKRARLSQSQLAGMLGVTPAAVSSWEVGQRQARNAHAAMLAELKSQLDHADEIDKYRSALLNVVGLGVAAFLTHLIRSGSTDSDDSPDD